MSERLEETVEHEAGETPEEENAEKLGRFKLDITRDADIVDEQRDQANEDMRFVNVTGGMWEGFLQDDYNADRVKLEFDVVSNYLQRFLGEWDNNRMGVDFKADDDKTTEDDAEMLNGIYRSDFRNFSGKMATDLAVEEAATCGYGAFKLATRFEDDFNPENDNQTIEWRPIHNAYNTVFWDEAAQRIDKRDARWCTVLKAYTKGSFEAAYPGESPSSAYTPETRKDWNRNSVTPELVYIATRYEAVRRKEKVYVYNNLETQEVEVYSQEDHDLIADELKSDEFRTFVRKRMILRCSVEKTVFSGEKILQETRRIAGKWIPVVPFYGHRTYVDGIEWYRGLVRKLKDAARLYNMQVSQLAENAASSGQEVPIFLRDQMLNPDIQALWADKNNKPYLLVDPAVDSEGNSIAAGPIAYSKPPQLDGSTAALLSIVPGFIQDVTGGVPQEVVDPDVSGKAIREMRKLINLTTSKISSNISESIAWSGEIYQAMAAEVYTTQRIMSTIGKDGSDGKTQLFKTVLDGETGKLIESNTLKGKKFRSYADVGPQYETMREQTVEDLKGMMDVLATSPGGQQYTPAIIAVLLQNITGVGLDPIKELNRRIMLAQGLVKPENEEEEAMLEQLSQPQPDAQQQLIEAAANQQNAEARSLDASSMQKVADSNKKEAETAKIITEISGKDRQMDLEEAKVFLEAKKLVAEEQRTEVEAIPFGLGQRR